MSQAIAKKDTNVRELTPRRKQELITKKALAPGFQAAVTVDRVLNVEPKPDLDDLAVELQRMIDEVVNGSTVSLQASLASQIQVLEALFHELTRRAVDSKYLKHFDAMLRYSLKAQRQMVLTADVLVKLRNPLYAARIEQANLGQNVQVVNGSPPGPRRTQKKD